ncbi:MAG TPA: hypothetical protein VFV73_04980 [Streptosporangiaceae bacterium]|nr:hypothetical protein [Streptosporangiaceae bacterium]
MTVQPALALDRLFTPGARLGWVFRDPRRMAAPFPEPRPDPERTRDQVAARAAAAQARYARARRWVVKPSLAAGLTLALAAGYLDGRHHVVAAVVFGLGAAAAAGSGLGYTAGTWWWQRQAAAADPDGEYHQARDAWEVRAAAHRRTELARLGPVPSWSSAEPPTRRTDVFGGSLPGWRGLLTVHGASLLAARPLLVVDLSGQLASDPLTAAAHAARVPGAWYALPADLDRCGLLTRLTAAQFADALTEAIHAGAPGGAQGTRTDRAVDVRILEQLGAVLGGRVSPARLAAAVAAALGHPVPPGLLSPREQATASGGLFPAGYQQQIIGNLVRLDAFLADLARYTGYAPVLSPPPAPAWYTCLALDPAARSARGEMLTALAVQWLTVQVSASLASTPAVIVAGADEITRPHLERLAGACEQRGVPLTFLFRHLREDSLAVLGGGTAAFMRLGHHAEAEQAANYLGRRHTFVLSQLTASHGGSESLTRSDSYGHGDGTTSSSSWAELSLGPGSRSDGRSTSRNWSAGSSWADGTNWSDAASLQRVYEYAVEPAILQNLPDHALLLAARGRCGRQLRAVECDPAISTLADGRLRQQPPLPVPAQARPSELATPLPRLTDTRLAGLYPRASGYTVRTAPGPPPGGTDAYQ